LISEQEVLMPHNYKDEQWELVMSKGDPFILNGEQFLAFKKASLDGATKLIHFKNFGISIAHVVSYERINMVNLSLLLTDRFREITEEQRQKNEIYKKEIREKLFKI